MLKQLALSVLLASISSGAVTPTQAPWVDPNLVHGRLLISSEVRVGTGIACWGSVVDPDGDPINVMQSTVLGPAGLAAVIDPNGSYAWNWRPTADQIGVHYIKMQVFEKNNGQVLILQDTATFAIKVNQENRPPVITLGGFTIIP